MEITVTRRDVIWGYIAIFFQMTSGLIILPFLLRLLTAEEIGFNYLMLTVGQMVALFDSGFSPMFGKNIAYLFSGAQELKKEGIVETKGDSLNYHLIFTMISVAKMVYRRLSVVVLVLMLTGGTVYIYSITNGFSTIKNSFLIWIVYTISTFFNIYFSYYNALLTGSGKIMESKKAIIINKVGYIVISLALLYGGLGLLGVCIANLLSPFIGRYFSYVYFYTPDFCSKIKGEVTSKEEVISIFKVIWYNSKKMSICMVGSYCINKFGMFLSGLYLSLEVIASYGLMLQLVGILSSVAQNYFITKQPQLASYKVNGERIKLLDLFSFSWFSFSLLNLLGCVLLVVLAPLLLDILNSNTHLPSKSIMLLFCIVYLLEQNHSVFSSMMIVGNIVPPISAAIIPGVFTVILSYLFLEYTSCGLMSIIMAQGICQLAYNNWKWPLVIFKEYNISPFQLINLGFIQINIRLKNVFKKL